MDVPASIPRSILPILARAKELSTRDPVIAYWCKLRAAEDVFKAKPSDEAGQGFMLSLLDDLEAVSGIYT